MKLKITGDLLAIGLFSVFPGKMQTGMSHVVRAYLSMVKIYKCFFAYHLCSVVVFYRFIRIFCVTLPNHKMFFLR